MTPRASRALGSSKVTAEVTREVSSGILKADTTRGASSSSTSATAAVGESEAVTRQLRHNRGRHAARAAVLGFNMYFLRYP
jgi:hypothetical protein